MKPHRIWTLPVLAGALIGAAVLGTPGIASADQKTQTVTLTCRDGECTPKGGDGESAEGPAYSVRTWTDKWTGWGGERDSRWNRGRGAWDGWNWDSWNGDGYGSDHADAQCSAGEVAVNVAIVCDNDIANTIWIDVDQWGDGNQLNLILQVQNITQIAASGSGNASNQNDSDIVAADVEQTNTTQY